MFSQFPYNSNRKCKTSAFFHFEKAIDSGEAVCWSQQKETPSYGWTEVEKLRNIMFEEWQGRLLQLLRRKNYWSHADIFWSKQLETPVERMDDERKKNFIRGANEIKKLPLNTAWSSMKLMQNIIWSTRRKSFFNFSSGCMFPWREYFTLLWSALNYFVWFFFNSFGCLQFEYFCHTNHLQVQ